MNRAIKSLNFLAVIILIAVILGCNSDGGGQGATQALTENDFSSDPTLSADPEKHLIVHFLEHPDSEKPENDTGEVGVDTIPFRYTRTLEHAFCWEDDDGEAGHFMVLEDSEGNEIFRLDVNGECITVVLEAGDYLMHIHHDGRIEETIPIFIVPGQNGEQEAQKIDTNEGLLKSAKSLFSKILNNLHNIITQTTNAQTPTPTPTVEDNLSTLLSTGRCVGAVCNLMGVDLSGKDLVGVTLNEANLTKANLEGANLDGADLIGAVLIEANLASAILRRANLNGADLFGANLTGANLDEAILSGADLTGANLTGVILNEAELVRANLTEADLSGKDLIGAVLIEANLFRANLEGANLTGADLTGAVLIEANLFRADLTGADLTVANLAGAILTGANLFRADLTGANLTDAILTDANLTGAILTRAVLTGATWCDDSICTDQSIGICETGARFMDNCDGTITDTVETFQNETSTFVNLIWEKKVDGPAGSCLDDDKLHSVDATCNWFNAMGAWITKLNNTCNNDPTMDCTTGGDADCIVSDCCGFACHSDWRLPEGQADLCRGCFIRQSGTAEFETIVDCSFGQPCIDPIFGPTAASFYWSATTVAGQSDFAWEVFFYNGNVGGFDKDTIFHVRAVRPQCVHCP